jgi:hypothetical protein
MRPYLITAKLMRPSNMKRFPTPELNYYNIYMVLCDGRLGTGLIACRMGRWNHAPSIGRDIVSDSRIIDELL